MCLVLLPFGDDHQVVEKDDAERGHHTQPVLGSTVRGSLSARVPRSSIASVRRVLVPHIVEEEADDQENEKEDEREDGKQRAEGRVVESTKTTTT